MIRDIIGEWEVNLVEKGRQTSVARIEFVLTDDKVVVRDADPEAAGRPARVEFDGERIRFELLSGGSSRGSIHYVYEIRLNGDDTFDGTRRRGMLTKSPIAGQRVALVAPAPADAAAVLAKAEAEVVAALEVARRAAERAAAARAAVPTAEPTVQPSVAPVVLATLPAPTAPPAPAPAPVPVPEDQHGKRMLRVSHRLTRGEIVVLAAEIHSQVYVWGGSYAAADPRLREAGWQIVEIDTDEVTEVDDALSRHAAAVRESVTV